MSDYFLKKYRPKCLDAFLFPNDRAEIEVRTYTDNKRHGHIFFYGPPGTGKTLLTRLMPRVIYTGADWEMYRKNSVHAFDAKTEYDRNTLIERMRKTFYNKPLPGFDGDRRIGIINELDDIVTRQVALMKNILDFFDEEDYWPPVMLLCTANTTKFPEPVRDRMNTINIFAPPIERLLIYGRYILAAEGKSLSDERITELAERAAGSVRGFIRELEGAVYRQGVEAKGMKFFELPDKASAEDKKKPKAAEAA